MSLHIDPAKIFVVIPVFNEHAVIRSVVDELLAANYFPVVVDDGSEQGIGEELKGRKLFYLKHDVNLGQGAALQTGIEFALSRDAEFIVTFDADGQHKVNDIGRLVDCLAESKADVALGSRFISSSTNNIPKKRKWLLQTARYFNFLFTGLLLTDAHNGLRALTRKAATEINMEENRMAHATEFLTLIKKNKLKYVEVPVTIVYTNYSLRKGQRLGSSFRIFFDLLLNKIFK